MQSVSHLHIAGVRASLGGYRRYAIKGEAYPAIVPHAGGRVAGMLYRGIPPAAWRRLDSYEGEMYQRCTASVLLESGGTVTAETYVLKPAFAKQLAKVDWDFEKFLQCDKSQYLRALS